MSNYSFPDLTQRELVEASLTTVETLIASIEAAHAEAVATQDGPLDTYTAGKLGNYSVNMANLKPALEDERIRLQNVLNAWDGQPLIEGNLGYTYVPNLTFIPPVPSDAASQ